MLIADYYAGCRSSHAAVDIYRLVSRSGCVSDLRNARREHVETLEVSGKREAHQIAANKGAKPWNF